MLPDSTAGTPRKNGARKPAPTAAAREQPRRPLVFARRPRRLARPDAMHAASFC
jgi:hypothetical protein